MPTPKASIVIPCYNAQKYLPATLDSALTQTVRDIEVVCVDNNSTDGTAQVLASYAERDPRVRVLAQKDPGEGPAREAGRRAATGEWLYFLDADDLMLPDLLQKAIAEGEKTQADLVIFQTITYNDQTFETIHIDWSFKTDWLPDGTEVFDPHEHPEHILNSFQNWVHNKLFRRSFVDAHGLEFQHVHRTADLLFTCSALSEARRIALLREPLHKYRVMNLNSAMATSDSYPLDFYQAFLALRRRLEADGTWELYHDSFVNWAIEGIVVNLETARSFEGFKAIVQKMREEGGRALNIEGFPYERSDRDYRWQRMQSILHAPMLDLVWEHYAALKVTNYGCERHASDIRHQLKNAKGDLAAREAEVADLRRQLDAVNGQLTSKTGELEAIKRSASFKIGRKITEPARKLRH